MTDNPTGAENAQVQDDTYRRAREIAVATGWRRSSADRAAVHIATALREARREGILDAVRELKILGVSHRNMAKLLLKTKPALSEMQKIRAEECEDNAQAIERAATQED